MLGRRRDNKLGGGVAEQRKIIAFDRVGHTEMAMPSRLFAPPKLFLATSAAADDDDEEVDVPEHAVGVMSPTYILSSGAVPFSRGGSSGGVDRRTKGKNSWPWDARPIGLGLAGALNGEATGAATTILTGQTLRPVHTMNSPSCSPSLVAASKEFGVNCCRTPALAKPTGHYYSPRQCLSPSEMEASEDYTRVIARGPNPRTVHIFDDHVDVNTGGLSAGGGKAEFLRWCHGCSKDLGQGNDIFMYRGEMACCSHECRYREMLFHEKL